MKTISLLFFISIFINSVFSDEVKSVSVMEGDSVTLHTHFTDTQVDDVTVVWTFGPQKSTIAKINREPKGNKISIYDDVLDGRFRDRLQLNDQTGDLTITDITTQHTGVYEVEITVISKIIQKSFNVNGVINPESDQLKSVSVKDADSVTLHPDVPDIKKYNVIQWRFKGIRIAHFNKSASEISEDKRFRDKLQLDVQTGSLQIKTIRTDLSGLYEVEISSTSSVYTIHQPFAVTVSGEVKSVSVMMGDPLTIYNDVPDIKTYDQILLIFGCDEKWIAEVNIQNKKFTLYGIIRDRLKLNDQTGDLTITNIRTEDAGHYELKMSSRRRSIQRRFSVSVSEQGLSPGAIAGISVIFLLLAAAAAGAAGGVIYYRRKIAKAKQQLDEIQPLQVYKEESKPLQMDEEESKPLQVDVEESKPLQMDEEESKPLQVDEEESKPLQVDEGESVNLKTDTDIQRDDERERRFGETLIAEINPANNISSTYDACREKMEIVSVNEGESYTLKNTLTYIKRDDLIEWRFEETLIAEINPANNIFSTYDGDNDLFKDKLKLNPQTGDLKIKDIRKKHTGVYTLKIIRDRETSYNRFTVSLYACREKMEIVSVNEGESYTLKNTLTDIKRDDLIEWRFRETLIAEMNPANNISRTYDGDDDLFRDKLKLNHQTGDLNINDIRKKHIGVYILRIIRDRETLYKRFTVSLYGQ